MFGRKKQARIQKQLLNQIDEILRDPNIKDVERKSLKRVKTRLEKGEYLQRVLNDFLADVKSLALKSQLTPSVSQFYLSIINDTYENSGWGGIRFMQRREKPHDIDFVMWFFISKILLNQSSKSYFKVIKP